MKGLGWMLGAALLVRALPAGACWIQPQPGYVGLSIPEAGGGLPANSALLLTGHELDVRGLSATLDGESVSVVLPDLPFEPGLARWALGFEPAPAPGQRLQLSGTACSPVDPAFPDEADYPHGMIDETACDVALAFEITEPWQVPPPTVSNLRLEVFDHSRDDPTKVPGCADPSTITYKLYATLTAEAGELAPSAFVTAEFTSAKNGTALGDITMRAVEGEQELTLARWDLELGQDPCVRVTAWDATGQASETVESCGSDRCVYEDYSGKTTNSCNISACSCRLAELGRASRSAGLLPLGALCLLAFRRLRGRLGRTSFLAQNRMTAGDS